MKVTRMHVLRQKPDPTWIMGDEKENAGTSGWSNSLAKLQRKKALLVEWSLSPNTT